MIYELLELVTGGARRLVSGGHATRDEALAALPGDAIEDEARGWWADGEGRCYVVEAVVE